MASETMAHSRHLPAPALRDFVEHYWFVHWDLRGEPPFVQETLPHPSVHWITERGRSAVYGVHSGRFTRVLAGEGRVFGVKFKPGGFYPFRRRPVAGFANRSLTLEQAFGSEGAPLAAMLLALDGGDSVELRGTAEQLMSLAERFLLERLPPPDPHLPTVAAIVQTIMTDREITKVDALVPTLGMSKRALQRAFGQYVGVSPKWVIQRYRLHEAVERVAAGEVVNWSDLAVDLGYFDQTHFIKDFKALIGASPVEYAKTLAASRCPPATPRG
jgi:AraC-like DNA-binding protein